MMNRKWMVAGGLAAVLALVGGIVLGRKVIGDSKPTTTTTPAVQIARFEEPISGVSIAYPADWQRFRSSDGEVRLLVAADASTSLSLRVTKTGLTTVTTRSLPIVKEYTDALLKQDTRARQLSAPAPVEVGGLPGWRYRYAYGSDDGSSGAHVHYFLFKNGRLIQLVFQTTPADRLKTLEPTFEKLAGTFRGTSR